MSSYDDYEPGPRGWSPVAVVAIALVVVLLGAGGAVFGIYVANKNATASLGPGPVLTAPVTPTVSPSGASPTPTPPPSTTPTPTPTPTPTATATDTSFALPDLSGMDFRAARTRVRELKLGWRLVFEGTTGDLTVRATDPPASSTVHKGVTIKIFVKGPAPLAVVPDVRGMPCADAAAAIVDAGLYPDYGSPSRTGAVTSQSPLATDPPTLHWNDEVQLTCG